MSRILIEFENSKRKYTNKCKREIKRVCTMGRVSLQCIIM